MAIVFGTDGWRGVMAEDFTFANLRRVSTAVARYIIEQGRAGQGLVVGYDTRFLAEEFARAVTGVLTAQGIKVYLTDKAAPTPVTAYSVLKKQAAGAVMLTASHNPPVYNGFKFIPDYAGPAMPDVTDRIARLAPEEVGDIVPREELVTVFDPQPDYLSFLANQVDLGKVKASGLRLVVNPMHGAGIGYLEKVFAGLGLEVTPQRDWRDPLFGGQMPEPKAELLADLRQAVLRGQGDLGLALDGDADRFGIIDATGAYILPNQVLVLLARYLLAERGLRGPIARTISTTTLLDRIAWAFGADVIETPVGFKYLAQAMLHQGAILGGEESGGLSVSGHIPEKDGILACLLMAEVTAHYGKPLSELLEDIYREYGRLHTKRLDIHCSNAVKEAVLVKMETFAPAELAGVPVTQVVRIDGCKYVLADGSWLLIRPSGTEALFRLYSEAESRQELEAREKALVSQLGLPQ